MSAMERFLVFKKIAISLIKNLFSYFESNYRTTGISIEELADKIIQKAEKRDSYISQLIAIAFFIFHLCKQFSTSFLLHFAGFFVKFLSFSLITLVSTWNGLMRYFLVR